MPNRNDILKCSVFDYFQVGKVKRPPKITCFEVFTQPPAITAAGDLIWLLPLCARYPAVGEKINLKGRFLFSPEAAPDP